jgi:NADH pyrophosphatase NudC (nudix superfamily)
MVMYSELPTGQRLYLDNQGIQTIVTLASGASGQQQQSSSSFTTGVWTKEPEIQITPQGVIINIITATGNHSVHIQGTSISLSSPNAFSVSQSSQSSTVSPTPMTPMTPMAPMAPMTPMKMGNMSMSFSPMEMQIGDMKMSMGEAKTANKRQFCSQCGAKVSESDRFCSSCGHQLE